MIEPSPVRLCDGQPAADDDIPTTDIDARAEATLCPVCQQNSHIHDYSLRPNRYQDGRRTLAHLYSVPVQYAFDGIRNCPHCRENPGARTYRAWKEARKSVRVLHREFQGAGAIITMAAPPSAWLTSWPGLPGLSAVHLVYVDETGRPAVDRGLTKRTYAAVQDAVVVLGCPLLEQTMAPVEVAEGLADALTLASRSPAPAVATLGTSGMSSAIIAEWLATSPATQVWADRDEAKAGRAPPGQRYGRELVRLVNDAGGNAIALHTPSPHKDPAAAAASIGFNDPGPAWPEYARTLSETTDWPRWEIARQAMAMRAEEA